MKTMLPTLMVLLLPLVVVFAQQPAPPESGVYFMPHVDYEWQDRADFDDQAGSMSRSYLGVELGFKRYLPRNSYARIYARYGEHEFDFDGTGPESSLFSNPLGTIVEEEVGAILLKRRVNPWGYYLRLGFVSMRDPDAHLVSSTEARAMGIMGYRVKNNLELGFGIYARSQVSQAPRFYPIPVINYAYNQRLQLVTSDQISLQYAVVPGSTTLVLSSAPKRWRMRLADNEVNDRGIAEYERVPLSLSLDQIVHKNVKVTLTSTLIPYHTLSMENADGDKLDETDLDPTIQFSARLGFRF